MLVKIEDELDHTQTLVVAKEQFGMEAVVPIEQQNPDFTYWDYGNCISCNKAQGGQWRSVAVFEECHRDWSWPRWAYTAATRAEDRLLYCR